MVTKSNQNEEDEGNTSLIITLIMIIITITIIIISVCVWIIPIELKSFVFCKVIKSRGGRKSKSKKNPAGGDINAHKNVLGSKVKWKAVS